MSGWTEYLVPEGLKLGVVLDLGVAVVEDLHVVGNVVLKRAPELQSVRGVRVVLDHELNAVFGGRVLDGHAALEQVVGERLLLERPVQPIHHGAHLHGVMSGREVQLNNASGVDERLSGGRVNVHGVLEVRHQHLVHRVHYAQLPVRGDDEWLHARMGTQTARAQIGSISLAPYS